MLFQNWFEMDLVHHPNKFKIQSFDISQKMADPDTDSLQLEQLELKTGKFTTREWKNYKVNEEKTALHFFQLLRYRMCYFLFLQCSKTEI